MSVAFEQSIKQLEDSALEGSAMFLRRTFSRIGPHGPMRSNLPDSLSCAGIGRSSKPGDYWQVRGARWYRAMTSFAGDSPYNGAPYGPNCGSIVPVGTNRPNAWGQLDMHGNVWEWCRDEFADALAGGRDSVEPRRWLGQRRRGLPAALIQLCSSDQSDPAAGKLPERGLER